MPVIEFLPSKKTIHVAAGALLHDAAEIDVPCGGKGTCGKCVVKIKSGQVDTESFGMLPPEAATEGIVLACRTRVLDECVVVEVPDRKGYEGGKFSDEDETYLVRGELLPQKWQYDPLAVKWLLQVPGPKLGDGLSDLDRLTRAIQQWWGKIEIVYPLSVIRDTAEALRSEDGQVTITFVRDQERVHAIRIEKGDTTLRHFAIAVDVGTTTIAVQLINLGQANILCTRTDYNGQIPCGLDVISRINYAARPDRQQELRTRVLDTINKLIKQAAESHGVQPEEICNAVISGNTTMTHLLLGLKPEYIRLDPYTPTVHEVPYLNAADTGITINPDSWIYFSPSVGSYVGGDITAGVLCTDLSTPIDEMNLFIDIGTNGEIVLGNKDFLMACACSAGPAFEGSGIECGMRAALGAVEKVKVDPITGIASYSTIGDVRPKGICGSGIIDLLAELFITGWLDSAGKLNRVRECACIKTIGKRTYYIIVPETQSGIDKPIMISELDIENIIRAKAAIYSACTLMLNQAGMDFNDLAHIYIAGGFGRFLDLEKAKIIGLVPDVAKEKFHYIGNASLMGSYMVVVSQEYKEHQQELARRMTYMELSSDPAYMDHYTGALFLPHTDPSRFPSVLHMKQRL